MLTALRASDSAAPEQTHKRHAWVYAPDATVQLGQMHLDLHHLGALGRRRRCARVRRAGRPATLARAATPALSRRLPTSSGEMLLEDEDP